MQREQVWKGLGLVDVYEDAFSTTDRLQGARVAVEMEGYEEHHGLLFWGCLESLVGREKSGWTKERIERLRGDAIRGLKNGVYHILDQVCIAGRKDGGAGDKAYR